jgi:preprotein translocase subunit YajC
MGKITLGDRVYHFRKGDSIATEGYGTILEIGSTRVTLRWEHNGKHGSVERRDLMTELEAT